MPATVARAVADDVVSAARRPDAVLFVGGLVALATLGVLEWSVAAVAGVGIAIRMEHASPGPDARPPTPERPAAFTWLGQAPAGT